MTCTSVNHISRVRHHSFPHSTSSLVVCLLCCLLIQIRLTPDSRLSSPPSHGHSSPTLLHSTATLASDPYTPSSFTLNFLLSSERDKWHRSLESAMDYLSKQQSNGSFQRLLDLAARMHHAVPAMDRFYHLIRYRKCVLGSEAVLWLIHDQRCSQDEAVALGNQMIDLGFLHHVSHEHFLCHAYLFYRFNLPALAESDHFRLQLDSSGSSSSSSAVDNTTRIQQRGSVREGEEEEEEDEDEECVEMGPQGGGEEQASLSLLHAVEDLEVENRVLRDRMQQHVAKDARRQFASTCQLEDALSTLEGLEQVAVTMLRSVAVLLVLLVLSPALSLLLGAGAVSPETNTHTHTLLLMGVHLGAVEYFTQIPSQLLHQLLVRAVEYCGGDSSCVLLLPSCRLRERVKERDMELKRLEEEAVEEEEDPSREHMSGSFEDQVHLEDTSSGLIPNENTSVTDNDTENGNNENDYRSKSGSVSLSDYGMKHLSSSSGRGRGRSVQELDSGAVVFPPPSEWPNFPLLVRRSPDMFRGYLSSSSSSSGGVAARTEETRRTRAGTGIEGESGREGEGEGGRSHVCSMDKRMLADLSMADIKTDTGADSSGDTDSDTDDVDSEVQDEGKDNDKERYGAGADVAGPETSSLTASSSSGNDSGSSNSLAFLTRPVQIHQHPPESSVFPVDNHLFKGKVFIILAGLPDSPEDFFSNKNRLFEVVVQGRFKQVTPYSSVYNGQVFKKPFLTLPPKWMMRILLGLLSKIQPGLQVSLHGERPYMVSSLIAASKNVVVSIPGTEPDICITREGGIEAVREDLRLLVTAGGTDMTAKKIFNSRSASKRAHYFSDLKHLDKYSYSPEHVYTFDFYQHVLNIGQMKLDLGFASLDVSSIIGFSPVQVMAVQWDPHNEPNLEDDEVDYFYNIEMWNKKSFPADYFE